MHSLSDTLILDKAIYLYVNLSCSAPLILLLSFPVPFLVSYTDSFLPPKYDWFLEFCSGPFFSFSCYLLWQSPLYA